MSAAIDPITAEVVRNAYNSIAEDMAAVMSRSAFSMVIYECNDFGIAFFNENVELLGQFAGLPLFVGGLDSGLKACLEKFDPDELQDGDILTVNDTYMTGGHLMDVDVIGVIRYQGELVGYTSVRAHWMDIGTASPGYPVNTTNIFQEGLRWGPTLIMRNGEFVRDVLDIFCINSRMPKALVGDLSAQIAAIRQGSQRYRQLMDRFGLEVVRRTTRHILDLTEARYRAFISSIPDGVYEAEGYSDNDGISDVPVKLKVAVTVAGDEMTIDTTGTAPQTVGNLNTGLANSVSAARLAVSFLYPDPDPKANHGSFVPIHVVAEPGTVLYATEPAPCMHPHPVMLLIDLIIKALAPVLPSQVAAGLPGDSWNIYVRGNRADTNEFYMSGEAMCGGWGACQDADGESALIHSAAGDFRNIPVELAESTYPFLIRRSQLGIDSGGAGKHRGGLNVVKEYELGTDAILSFHFDRSYMPCWGLFGGLDGARPRVMVYPSDGREPFQANKVEELFLPKGSTFVCETGGGGGYGDPRERDPRKVVEDVQNGYVSPEAARTIYGVDVS
jgi:N-methylhydantoinase B